MRVVLAASLIALALPAFSQSTARPRPPGTVPLEEPPPPPPMIQGEDAPEPQVTTRTEGDQVVQEYRIGGKLYMQRVTPKGGKPYILVDYSGDGTFTKLDNTLDAHMRVPQWVVHSW
jgi:Protein of unknown function (DUF2782)